MCIFIASYWPQNVQQEEAFVLCLHEYITGRRSSCSTPQRFQATFCGTSRCTFLQQKRRKMWNCCGVVQSRNTRVAERATDSGLSNSIGKTKFTNKVSAYRHISFFHQKHHHHHHDQFTRFTLYVATPLNRRCVYTDVNDRTHTNSEFRSKNTNH